MNEEEFLHEQELLAVIEEDRVAELQASRFAESQAEEEASAEGEKKEPRISVTSAALMIIVALMYDAIQAGLDFLVIGLVVNYLFDVWAWLTFYIWFKIKGISFANPKRGLALNGGLLVELIPAINALPAWTLAVVIIIATVKAEDVAAKVIPAAEKFKKLGELKGKLSSSMPKAA